MGLSGGADSVCLLDVLNRLSEEFLLKITAIHIHHGIRGKEADRDMEFAKNICKERNIEFKTFYYDVPSYAKDNGLSEEEAGRKLRYETFFKEADGKKIAVAHNLNDNVETFIHNVCRGSGLTGLTGIKPVAGKIIRPLLCLERKEIENYLEKEKILFINDSTNFEEDYTRNKIRLNVIPYLQQNINNKTVEHINETEIELAETEEYLDKVSNALCEKIFVEAEKCIFAKKEEFAKLDLFMRKRLIRIVIEKIAGKLKDITRVNVNAVSELVDKQSGKYLMLPYNIIVRTEQDRILFERKSNTDILNMEKGKNEKIEINKSGKYTFGNFEFEVEVIEVKKEVEDIKNLENSIKKDQKMYTKWFDYDKMNFTACLRYRQSGDYIVINNNGGKKKLKDYFIDNKVPLSKRDKVPVIADGNHIIWIYGYRISEYYKITEETKRIIKITGKDKLRYERQD